MIENEVKLHGSIEFPVELYHIEKNHPRYEMTFHYHTNIELVRILSGELAVSVNFTEYNATAGDLFVFNSNFVHGAIPKDCVYECLSFNPNLIPKLMYNGESFAENIAIGNILINEEYKKSNDEINVCLNHIFDAMAFPGEAARYTTLGALCEMYGIIKKEHLYTYADKTADALNLQTVKLKKALRFIRSSYGQDISLSDIAAAAGMSKKYFCSFFKQFTHKTPVEYLITHRIESASSLLLTTDRDVTDIAFSCGFNDLSYFIKTYKRIKGLSPGQFRKNSYKP